MFKHLLLAFSLVLFAMQSAYADTYQAGKDYEVLSTPVITHDPNKIEVMELFWYGCPHCFQFEPLLENWAKKQAADVDFQRMPAMWNNTMVTHAKAFYVAKALGVLDKAHAALFSAINIDRKHLNSEASLADFFTQFGVSKDDFKNTYNSFSVNSLIKLAGSRAASYHMQGTPEMIIDGKYRISSPMAGSHENMLKVADFLIAKERAERAKK